MSSDTLTPEQRAREQSIALGVVMDVGIVTVQIAVSVVGGSLTILAEAIRGGLGVVLEYFTYVVLRRIHRGVLADLDYGTGKLEQVANLVVGGGMLFGTGWIVISALRLLSGDRALGTPFGLAIAAIVGMVNIYINLVAWDGVRRAAATGDSLIMKTQLVLRRTKLFASLVVGVGLTVAALSTDDLVVSWADALGSLFVAGYMAITAWEVLRSALPDLLDRSAGSAVQRAVADVLTRHADTYIRVQRVRSRRSGHTAFVEIALEFEAGLTMAEVNRRVEVLKTTIRDTLSDVEVAILASAAVS